MNTSCTHLARRSLQKTLIIDMLAQVSQARSAFPAALARRSNATRIPTRMGVTVETVKVDLAPAYWQSTCSSYSCFSTPPMQEGDKTNFPKKGNTVTVHYTGTLTVRLRSVQSCQHTYSHTLHFVDCASIPAERQEVRQLARPQLTIRV